MTTDLGTDRALVTACLAGDETAWRRLLDDHFSFVEGVARNALARRGLADPSSTAEDVAGEVFASLLANDRRVLSQFREPFSIKALLAVMARRQAGKHLRKQHRTPLELEEPGHIAAEGRTVASDLVELERHAAIRDKLDDLAPRDRLALQLFYEGGKSYKEVAELLDLPVNRIGTLLARARKRLARSLGTSA